MTRVWSEGFEMRDLIGITNSGAAINTTTKRSGGASIRLTKSNLYFQKSITGIDEFYIRFGIYIDTFSTNGYIEYQWLNTSTVLGRLWVSHTGVLNLSIGSNYTILDSSPYILSVDTWYLIEAHILIDDAAGSVDVEIDGVNYISYSGDTKPGADTTANIMKFINNDYGSSGTADVYFDDMGLNDTAGGVDDSWLGDGKIIIIKPNADTATLDLTPSAAVAHYTLVDEVPADGDTTYVEGSVDDEEDMYDLEACGLGDVIITRIWTESRSRDTASSGKSVALITLASGGAEVSGGDVALAGTYTIKVLGAEELVNPVDASAWEVADIDALQAGIRTRP